MTTEISKISSIGSKPRATVLEVNATQARILRELLSKATVPLAIGRDAQDLVERVNAADKELSE